MSNLTAPPLTTAPTPAAPLTLPAWRMNLMRGAFLLMGVGLVVVKWPMLATATSLPPLEGALLMILTAVSLLSFVGLRYPVAMLPLLVFEVLWKVLWFGIVALPLFLSHGFDAPTETLLFSNLFVIPVILATPWDLVWKRFVVARGDRWTRQR